MTRKRLLYTVLTLFLLAGVAYAVGQRTGLTKRITATGMAISDKCLWEGFELTTDGATAGSITFYDGVDKNGVQISPPFTWKSTDTSIAWSPRNPRVVSISLFALLSDAGSDIDCTVGYGDAP